MFDNQIPTNSRIVPTVDLAIKLEGIVPKFSTSPMLFYDSV